MSIRLRHIPDLFPLTLVFLGVLLALFAIINMSGYAQPTLALNEKIIEELSAAPSLPLEKQPEALAHLRKRQEVALSIMPAEPFAWARYSYLRLATERDKEGAFHALVLSDLVSPEEPRQLPERALMWRQFASVESEDQKAYQSVLWQKAFLLQPNETWDIAKRNAIIDEVGQAIRNGDPDQYEIWKSRLVDK